MLDDKKIKIDIFLAPLSTIKLVTLSKSIIQEPLSSDFAEDVPSSFYSYPFLSFCHQAYLARN